MGIVLMLHKLTVYFVDRGKHCFFVIDKGNILSMMTDLMPVDEETCRAVLAVVAVVMGIPADEHAGLEAQMEVDLKNFIETTRGGNQPGEGVEER